MFGRFRFRQRKLIIVFPVIPSLSRHCEKRSDEAIQKNTRNKIQTRPNNTQYNKTSGDPSINGSPLFHINYLVTVIFLN